LSEKYNLPILFSVHPRTLKNINEQNVKLHDKIIISKPLGIIDYCCLQINSKCVISDSGTVTEESNILGFNAVLLRSSTEHPEGIDAGTVTIGNLDWENLESAIEITTSKKNNDLVDDYKITNFSEKVCNVIISYFSLINKFIWMKNKNIIQ